MKETASRSSDNCEKPEFHIVPEGRQRMLYLLGNAADVNNLSREAERFQNDTKGLFGMM
jgi:hypothetical protein